MYLLQVTTKDFALQLKTEVTADTIDQLLVSAKRMIKNNPSVIGMKYIVAKYEKCNGKLMSKTLKTDIIEGV